MNMEPDECYRAVQNRDAKYDGRFVTCVLTTKIYCRPICPARTPGQRNVMFLPCAAAAEEAGFRPCRRCCPESSPGMAAWLGTSAVVRRGLRMIDSGEYQKLGAERFAAVLGIGPRHLRRLFVQHLGCTAAQIARTKRVHFAKKLLVETSLPISEVALVAGFSSQRRFYSAFTESFKASPSKFRTKSKKNQEQLLAGYRLKIPVRLPYDWDGLLNYWRFREISCFERVTESSYLRTIQLEGQAAVVEFQFDGESVVLRIEGAKPASLLGIANKSREVLDSDCCPQSVTGVLEDDSSLAPLIKQNPGLRIPGCWDGLELAVRAIVGQQVSVKGATTIVSRIAQRFGAEMKSEPAGLSRLFPTATQLKDAPLEECGLIKSRANAVRALALLIDQGQLQLDGSADPCQTVEQLCQIPGIGPWTASYISLRVLRDPDAFPASDLVLRKQLASGEEKLTERELARVAQQWKPYRAYAAVHLWARAATGERVK